MPGIQAPSALRWVLHSPGSPLYKFDPVQVRDGREFDYLRVSMAEAKVAGSPTSQAGPGSPLRPRRETPRSFRSLGSVQFCFSKGLFLTPTAKLRQRDKQIQARGNKFQGQETVDTFI